MRRLSVVTVGGAVLAVVLVGVLAFQATRPGRARARGPLTAAERAVIAAYTAGSISRESPIRVAFTEPVVEASRIGSPVEPSPFRFEPAIAGTAVWTSRSQLEFRPGERLPDATSYAATLDLARLLEGRSPLASFEFAFATMKQSLQLSVDGLESADAVDIKRLRLTGKLVTADTDDAGRVERALAAVHGGRPLAIGWTHDANRRTHGFAVSGIVRAAGSSTLRLSWDGAALGVEGGQTREIAVPGLDTFTVDQARAVLEPEQYLELRFTDPLRTPQNLQGLVRVAGRDDLRFVISGSVVQVFAARGFRGEQRLRVAAGVRNVLGFRMKEARELSVEFVERKPQVRFAGKGVIVPRSSRLQVPIEAVNLRSVTVEAMRIPEATLPQFLQVNRLDGDQELNRVGRVVWRKTLPLDVAPEQANRWIPVGLDLSPLAHQHPDGLYRLTLSFQRPQIIWSCPDAPAATEPAAAAPDEEQEASNWDYAEDYQGDWRERYENRENPCHPGYYARYHDHDLKVSRNVLVSNLGLVAKLGEDDRLLVVATDLRSTAPVPGAAVTVLDYQQQTLGRGLTGSDGIATVAVQGKPFLAVVDSGGQRGYLRLDDGSALSTAHFDVAGGRAPKGLKGFLYGERGVWRPGDTLHLTFVLLDPARRLAEDHPARFELVDSRGQLVKSITRATSTDGFYAFEVATAPDAPTGNYLGRVTVGGASFEKTLKVETIMPNRLKIGLDFGREQLEAGAALDGTLSSSWLHGAPAAGLAADVELALAASRTSFARYPEHVFDDPAVRYQTETQKVFEGRLDGTGSARISATVAAENAAPGKLTASLTTRVFEPGGAFSVDRFTIPYSPYQRYVGIRTPKGDRARGMLLTDVKHVLDVVTLDAQGRPAGGGEVELRLYKVGWRWWWEHGEEDLSAYAESSVHTPLQSGRIAVQDGAGSWQFEVKYPEWGRYLITATDTRSGHRTGKLLYIDWPDWAGRGQKELEGGASVLSFAADKTEYQVGETVTLLLPTPKKGRVLVSVESGARVLSTRWLEAQGGQTRYSFPATREMAPNVYAHVTLLQPHAQTGNDLPIRMYGVVPIKVLDAETRLRPVVECAEVLQPESRGTLSVREAGGRAMTYTVAVVDEGLLGLTRFATPNPWDSFYAREALAVKTWDVFDQVVGAYGAAMERMLAIGGDAEGGEEGPKKRANRFPPMVRFLGPFRLAAGGVNTHQVEIPQYVGAVRVMVVAGRGRAFGAADRSVFVRRPLMLLATLPRTLGPQEQLALPVSVFALEPRVKDVSVSVTTSGPLTLVGPASKRLSFQATGDRLVSFRLATKAAVGVARAVIRAVSGTERAEQAIELDVRPSTQRGVEVLGATLKPGESWQPGIVLPGVAGTNTAALEVSRVPPLDLGRRLEYLLLYPHGCVEQTVSAAFPQLFLGRLVELSPERSSRVQANVRAALDRLRGFQTSEGGLAYWPGGTDPDDWATNYAGHFMVEARNAGYAVPPGLIEQWRAFQRRRARGWSSASELELQTQAYRLYTLALAQAPELPAMNQLRERGTLPLAARWRLAATYKLAGQPEAGRALVSGAGATIKPYRELAGTYGSDLRDRAMVLEAVVALEMPERIGPLAKSLSDTLSAQPWLSTQETAYALLALSRCAEPGAGRGPTTFSYGWNGAAAVTVTSEAPLVERRLEVRAAAAPSLRLRNTGSGVLYARLLLSGLPATGSESAASNGLALEVGYWTADGKPLDPSRLEQGTDLKVVARVTNGGVRGRLDQLALSHLLPAGWEVRNERMELARRRPPEGIEYQDVRDDRVYSYFDLAAGASQTVEILAHAAYVGRFYLPQVAVEPMYDASLNARTKGQWVEVVEAGAR